MKLQEKSLWSKKVYWSKQILAELKGLGGLSYWDISDSGDYYFALYVYESESDLYSGIYDTEGTLLHEYHKVTDISYAEWQGSCERDLLYFLYLSDCDIPQFIGMKPPLVRCYNEKSQMYLKNLETQQDIYLPIWAVRAKADYDWSNPNVTYLQLWNEKRQSQVQTLEGDVIIPLGKYEEVTLGDIAPGSSVGNKTWGTFRYIQGDKSRAGLWREKEILLDNVSWVRSSEMEDIFYLSEDYLAGECLYNIESEWRSQVYSSLYQASGNLFIGESKKNLELLTQKNEIQILQYTEDQIFNISPKEFDVWLAMDFSTTGSPNQFLFVKKDEVEGQIYCYQEEKWRFVQSTKLIFEENIYHQIRVNWDDKEESYMIIKEKVADPPSCGYYFLDTNVFISMENSIPFLPKGRVNLMGQMDFSKNSLTIFNREGKIVFELSNLERAFLRENKIFYTTKGNSQRYYYIDLMKGQHKVIASELKWKDNFNEESKMLLFYNDNGDEVLFLLEQECFIDLPQGTCSEDILYSSEKDQMII